jgi:hypothetical protein
LGWLVGQKRQEGEEERGEDAGQATSGLVPRPRRKRDEAGHPDAHAGTPGSGRRRSLPEKSRGGYRLVEAVEMPRNDFIRPPGNRLGGGK